MYEIWLMLNIVFEIARAIWPWLLGLGLLWALLLWRARGRDLRTWRAALPSAALLGALVGAVIFFATPPWNRSGLGEMNYWVDWANLIGITLAWAVAGTVLAWPAVVARRAGRR